MKALTGPYWPQPWASTPFESYRWPKSVGARLILTSASPGIVGKAGFSAGKTRSGRAPAGHDAIAPLPARQ
jgi:hypothetical protein